MARTKPPDYHTRRLSRQLRALRKRSGLKMDDVADKIGLRLQKVSRIELGQLVEIPTLRAFLDLYNVPLSDYEEYEDIQHSAAKRQWWDRLGRDETYLSMEHEAHQIRDVQTIHLPELLQTDDSLTNYLTNSPRPSNRERVAAEHHALHHRRRVLDQHAVQLHALIYQPVLHTSLSSTQLTHLIERAEQTNITIQIILHRLLHVTIEGSFTLLSFPDDDEPDIVFTKDPIGHHFTQHPSPVADIGRDFRHLAKSAMTPHDSHSYLKKLLKDRTEGSGGGHKIATP